MPNSGISFYHYVIFSFITITILNRTFMNFDFTAIGAFCCRNSQEHQDQRNQESKIQKYQSPQHQFNLHTLSIKSIRANQMPINHSNSQQCKIHLYTQPKTRSQIATNVQKQQTKTSFQPIYTTFVPNYQYKAQSISPHIHKKPLSPRSLKLAEPIMQLPLIHLQQNTVKQAARSTSPRINFSLNNKPTELRSQGKRLRTQEQQTDYSTKHSQIVFKNCSIGPENQQFPSSVTFKKHNSIFCQNVTFEQQHQTLKKNQQLSCKQVSAKYQIDHSFNYDLLYNARTIQSIAASSENRSKNPSMFPSEGCSMKERNKISILQFNRENSKQKLKSAFSPQVDCLPKEIKHNSILSPQRSYSPPSPDISPKFQQVTFSPSAQSNLFYGSTVASNLRKSPKISILQPNQENQNQQSQAQELRDVIDNHYLRSQYCSRANSPLISPDQSLKNLNQEREKKVVSFFHFSPSHSRQVSEQFALFKETRAKLQRTNTIESIGSHSSATSCIDVKFMQSMRSRRGVSRLI